MYCHLLPVTLYCQILLTESQKISVHVSLQYYSYYTTVLVSKASPKTTRFITDNYGSLLTNSSFKCSYIIKIT